MLQPSAYGVYGASNCGSPSVMGAKAMNFGYTASPRTGSANYYLTAAQKPSTSTCTSSSSPQLCPLWSACLTAQLQVIGPFAYPGLVAGTNDTAYIVTSASGTRYYADVSGATGSATITGIGNDDGADYTLYTTFPYLDDGQPRAYTAIPLPLPLPLLTSTRVDSH